MQKHLERCIICSFIIFGLCGIFPYLFTLFHNFCSQIYALQHLHFCKHQFLLLRCTKLDFRNHPKFGKSVENEIYNFNNSNTCMNGWLVYDNRSGFPHKQKSRYNMLCIAEYVVTAVYCLCTWFKVQHDKCPKKCFRGLSDRN